MELIKRIHTISDPALDKRNQLATEMEVRMKDGAVYHRSVDFPRGTPENPLTKKELMENFQDCVSYGRQALTSEKRRANHLTCQ